MADPRKPAAWEAEIAPDDFPPEFRPLAEMLGGKAALEVMRLYEGDRVYFPKLDGAFKAVRDKVIHREWKRCRDPRAIGQRHGLTSEAVRQIAGEHEDQLSLLSRP